MAPNLAFVDVGRGDLIARHSLPADMHKLSICHSTLDRDRTVWFACQNQGDIAEPMPLVGRATPSAGRFGLIELPQAETASRRGYVGSNAASAEIGLIAVTSPRGTCASKHRSGSTATG